MNKPAAPFASLKRTPLSLQVAEAIQERINAGDYAPGDLLPSERILSEMFDVSRVAIREAIQLLQAKDFIEVRQGKGSIVVDPAARKASSLVAWIDRRDETLRSMVELRRIVEPGIAELAAQNADDDEAAHLIGLAKLLETCERSDLSATDAEFHKEIARLTGNELVCELLSACLEITEPLRERTLKDRKGRKLAASGHLKIAEAIASGRPESARSAMLDHMNDAFNSL